MSKGFTTKRLIELSDDAVRESNEIGGGGLFTLDTACINLLLRSVFDCETVRRVFNLSRVPVPLYERDVVGVDEMYYAGQVLFTRINAEFSTGVLCKNGQYITLVRQCVPLTLSEIDILSFLTGCDDNTILKFNYVARDLLSGDIKPKEILFNGKL